MQEFGNVLKMKILLLLLILGTLLIGFVAAIGFGIVDVNFKERVLTISTQKICQAELLSNVQICNPRTPSSIDVDKNIISITKNSEGVIRVKNG